MYGSCYAGLPAIKAFVKKEMKDKKIVGEPNIFDLMKSWYVADG
jgi:hypothetical protein